MKLHNAVCFVYNAVRYVHIAVRFVYIAVRYEVFSKPNMFLYRSPGDEGANTFYKFMSRIYCVQFRDFCTLYM
jgi:hypothetical protein